MERIGEWLDRMMGPEPEGDTAVRARSKESVEGEMVEELGARPGLRRGMSRAREERKLAQASSTGE